MVETAPGREIPGRAFFMLARLLPVTGCGRSSSAFFSW
ncbi:hypothetical protein NY78_1263 [Desulfovibrio sp. TomC]|nr:hypothetical protein NY78_1263 [Desulfovibrio sp. TomC]